MDHKPRRRAPPHLAAILATADRLTLAAVAPRQICASGHIQHQIHAKEGLTIP